MKQKVLAILLSVVMLLGMLPVGIIAGANGDATEPALPAGTVGYVMDVPETEQFINWKNSDTGTVYFSQWHANFLMNNNAANAADPFNAQSFPSSGGGLYVRNIGGEGYMIWKAREVYTSAGSKEYADGTNDVNTAYGTLNGHNCTINTNNISALENTNFTVDATGFSAIDDADESGITHLAFRIKVIGGVEGQKSVFHLYNSLSPESKLNLGYTTAYFLDINTGAKYANQTTDTVIVLPEGDFDGYMVIPVPTAALAQLQASPGIRIYTFAAGTTYHKESNWQGRSVCFGDIFAVNNEDAFCDQYVPVSTAPADSSKNLMTVPAKGGFISYNDSSSYGSGKDWGLSRWSTSETKCTFPDGSSKFVFACMTSVTENGENFFKSYVNTTANFASTGAATIKGTFSPATYELNVAFGGTEQTFTALHADATDYGYIGIRFKTTGTSANGASTIGLYVGTGSGDMTITGTKVYNYKTGKITTVASGAKTFSVPDNFDGWFFLPSSINDTAVRVGINLKQNSATDNWDDKTIYVGNMKLVKSVDTFLAVNGAPAFTVTPAANDKLVVSNTVDAEKAALYTVDGENWYNIDAFNALTLEGSKYYTITARYPWGVEAATISKTVFNGVDTATMLLPAEGVLYCPGYNYGTYGLGWASSKTMRNHDNSGWSTGDSNNYLWSTTLDGERYWEVCDNPDVTGCRQFTMYPLFKKTVGDVYADAAEKYSHLAIRVRLEEDGTDTAVEGATYPVSINLFGPGGKDTHYDRWSRVGGVYFYDITTGETTEVTSVSQDIPLGFNGYLIFPSNAVYYGDLVEGDDPSTTPKVEESYYTNFRHGDISLMERVHVFMHNAGDHYSSETGNWTGVTLYLGDMELIEDDKAFLDVRTNCDYSGVHTLVAVEAAAPFEDNSGCIAHYACTQCGATYADAEGTTPVNPALLTFDAASLTLEQNITVNFKANAENLAGLTDVYAKVTFGTREAIIEAGEAVEGKYVFNFDEVGPHNFGTTITAQLFGTYGGVEYAGAEIEYSVKDYCYNKLAEYADATDKDEFKTLLVDLLNYGAKAQTYTGTDTSNLVNAGLKYSDRIFGTITPPTVNTGVRGVYDEIDETVTWNGVNLYFEDKASLKFRFTAASTEGLTVKVMDAKSGGNVLAEITEFKAGENGSSVALFNKLDATMMRDTVYVAVYNGETQVSEILAYSVVAYAGQKVIVNSESTTAQRNLAALVSHMIRYGDAAVAYAAANA